MSKHTATSQETAVKYVRHTLSKFIITQYKHHTTSHEKVDLSQTDNMIQTPLTAPSTNRRQMGMRQFCQAPGASQPKRGF